MPKKLTLPEPELHALVARDAKVRLGCQHFDPQFTLYRVPPDAHAQWPTNWALWRVENVQASAPDCAEAFMEAMQRACAKFDIAWPQWD